MALNRAGCCPALKVGPQGRGTEEGESERWHARALRLLGAADRQRGDTQVGAIVPRPFPVLASAVWKLRYGHLLKEEKAFGQQRKWGRTSLWQDPRIDSGKRRERSRALKKSAQQCGETLITEVLGMGKSSRYWSTSPCI